MPANLWKHADAERWAATIDGYWSAIELLDNRKLLDLERWYHEKLPMQLAASSDLTQEQLVKLMDWKLTRGKWRPRLLNFVKAATPDAVANASARALARLRQEKGARCSPAALKDALAALTELKGVGPATATAVLAAADPSVAFMSDEALTAALGAREYTVPAAVKLMAALQQKAEELSAAGARAFSARDVERALYAEAVAAKAAAPAPAKKRKR